MARAVRSPEPISRVGHVDEGDDGSCQQPREQARGACPCEGDEQRRHQHLRRDSRNHPGEALLAQANADGACSAVEHRCAEIVDAAEVAVEDDATAICGRHGVDVEHAERESFLAERVGDDRARRVDDERVDRVGMVLHGVVEELEDPVGVAEEHRRRSPCGEVARHRVPPVVELVLQHTGDCVADLPGHHETQQGRQGEDDAEDLGAKTDTGRGSFELGQRVVEPAPGIGAVRDAVLGGRHGATPVASTSARTSS